MTPTVLGLDLALEKTGIATATGVCFTSVGGRGDARLDRLYRDVYEAASVADLVIMEDLPTTAMSAGLTGRAHGVVRLALHRLSKPIVTVPPASLKAFATGKGAADKAMMAAALVGEFNLDQGDMIEVDARGRQFVPVFGLELTDDNQVDAFYLRQMGLYWLRARRDAGASTGPPPGASGLDPRRTAVLFGVNVRTGKAKIDWRQWEGALDE